MHSLGLGVKDFHQKRYDEGIPMLARQRSQFIAKTPTITKENQTIQHPFAMLLSRDRGGQPSHTHIRSEILAKEEDLTLILLKS